MNGDNHMSEQRRSPSRTAHGTVMGVVTTSAEETRTFGRELARILQAGDLIMLNGELGAGKTTLTQGIGDGLGVRGRVASPTFIVARVHPSLGDGPALIHADAYRITSLDDVETLDLDSSLDESVTVVEWGAGKTETLSDNRLEIDVRREIGGQASNAQSAIDLESLDDGRRVIVLRPFGDRWGDLISDLIRQGNWDEFDCQNHM